jgi:hypothetical protein
MVGLKFSDFSENFSDLRIVDQAQVLRSYLFISYLDWGRQSLKSAFTLIYPQNFSS